MNPPDEAGTRAVGVLTVDDQAAFRQVAREVIEATAGFVPLGEAASGEEALALADVVTPDLVVLDVQMPGIGGLETARRLSASHPTATIVLISAQPSLMNPEVSRACPDAMRAAGARGLNADAAA